MQEIVRIESPCPQEKSKVTGQVQRDGARDRSGRCKYLSWRHVNYKGLSWRHVNYSDVIKRCKSGSVVMETCKSRYKGKMWMCQVDFCFKSQVHSEFTDSF